MKKKLIPTILVIDIGGTHVKVMNERDRVKREFASDRRLSAKGMVRKVKVLTKDWSYDTVSIGYPGTVTGNRPAKEPYNLGKGWKGFDFEKAFGRPTKVVNDALMQALGSYEEGRMLFLGLGTGFGSAMIIDGVLVPMELAHLPYRNMTFEDYVGGAGLKRSGLKRWRRRVTDVVMDLAAALEPEYIVLGGGNTKKIDKLPPKARRGHNENAFIGGFRLWNSPRRKR